MGKKKIGNFKQFLNEQKKKQEAQAYISRNINEYKLKVNEWATVNGYE